MTNDYDSSASGYLADAFEGISQTFTDIEMIATSEVNVVAKAKRYGRWWLLKGLRPEVADGVGYQQRLRKELEILMQLQYPGVVATYGMEAVEGCGRCIVMEYVEGPTLKEWLTENHQRQDRIHIAQQLMEAVAYIHSKGIVHRDLKPENIIVTNHGGGVKLIDFGLADTDSHAILKQPAGTPRYMAPEQLQTAVADVRNDIYSLGVILKQMNVGWRYRNVIGRCLKPIGQRYQNAAELQHAFRAVNGLVKRTAVVMMVLLAVAILLLMGWQLWRGSQQDDRLVKLNETYQQERQQQQQQVAMLSDSIAVLRAYNQQEKGREAAAEARRQRVKNAITKGYGIIDEAMCQTNIDQHLDTLSDFRYLWPDFTKRSQAGLRATERYTKEVRQSFSAAEIQEITTALHEHVAETIKKWNKKIIDIAK